MLQAQSLETTLLPHPIFEEKGLQVGMLRLDKIHTTVSGNKFFKLKYNLEEAQKQGKPVILTFGGAFSNHIHACASAGKELGLKSIGVIRGEEMDKNNPTLAHAKAQGMELYFVSREEYRHKNTEEFTIKLKDIFGDFYLIPEGGTNSLAIKGTSEILTNQHREFSHYCTSIGTGGTFAGLALSLEPQQTLIGFSSLKGDFIRGAIQQLLLRNSLKTLGKLEINTNCHFGGYAKWTVELVEFILWFWKEFGIPLDPIYTGKMVAGFFDLVQKNHFPQGSKILLIHTGGLQGNVGFQHRTGISMPIL
jgi:1-aminocyclopropane-1-carboxylate deaminase/D-cysteine desulfhydrase-like pyridoxal-dependent ACC family enzyme